MWSDLSTFLSDGLLRTTLMLTATGIVAFALWWIMRPASAPLQRTLCLFVLVQGVLFWRLPLELPYSPRSHEIEGSHETAASLPRRLGRVDSSG